MSILRKWGYSGKLFYATKSVAILCVYFDSNSDLLNDYTNLELISTIAYN